MKTLLATLILTLTAIAQTPIAYKTTKNMQVTLTNTSGQPIVALIVDITGKDSKTIYRHDFFSKAIQFDPNVTLDAMVDSERDPTVKQWKIEVIWCQFSDGSQWGDVTRGKFMLDARASTQAMLAKLATADDETFAATIAQLDKSSTGPQARTVRTLQEDIWSGGVATARANVMSRLQNAVARRAVGNFQ